MSVACFARRITAPFQGVLQVIRAGHGEAESTDGVHWVLYVAHPDILAHSGLSEVRFGTWSAADGLRRAAIRGTAAGGLIEAIGGPLIEALERCAGDAPFPLHDRFECWLLDQHTQAPLVLIDSRLPVGDLPPAESARWLPGVAARAEFRDLAVLEDGLLVRSGSRPVAQWFERDTSGDAVDGEGRLHSQADFPRLLLTTDWPEPRLRSVAEAFIAWWAPALLQLQHLDDHERRRLEQAAARRAGVVERLFRLYPKTLDERLLRVVRVQARMQVSQSAAGGYEEPFLWSE